MSMRTIYCGGVTEGDSGREITVCGWVNTSRDMGGVIFLDVHDREGTLQVVCCRELLGECFPVAEGLHPQCVIKASGKVRSRSADTYNPKLKTGTVELAAEQLTLISRSAVLPYDPDAAVREDLRLRYRYIDLRRDAMQDMLRFRHKLIRSARNFLDGEGFTEVETPVLTKSTPEGAREFFVPSRNYPGEFYSLAQSPQIFKQLLMVGGVDRYYQLARCFRDEDLRADRQPEFTQMDMELSFMTQEEILQLLERLFIQVTRECGGVCADVFPRLTWLEAMDLYGSDKPDLRFDMQIADVTDAAAGCGFSVFERAVTSGGVVRAITVPGGADFTHGDIDELTNACVSLGADGMAWIMLRPDGEIYSILTKFIDPAGIAAIVEKAGAKAGDFILFSAGKLPLVRRVLGGVRLRLGDKLGLRGTGELKFAIITDFPMFEWSDEEGRYSATHHQFTMPYPEDVPYLLTAPEKVRAEAYDFVLNGIELGSGSIRIHDPDVQKTMFTALGFTDGEIVERFGFMIEAFRYGTPPHGGFAFGVDRLIMQLTGAKSLRDVIAFPKLGDGSCPLTDAPGALEPEQLKVLGLNEITSLKVRRLHEIDAEECSAADVEIAAKLSSLTPDASFAADLYKIIALARRMSPPAEKRVPREKERRNILRDDVPHVEFSRESLLANAAETEDGYIRVPRVVE